jgi:hypothetical protein
MIIGIDRSTWRRRVAIAAAAGLLMAGTASRAAAQDAGAAPAPAAAPAPDPDKVTLNFFRNTEIGGLVDGYYDYFSTKQDGAYRNFDFRHNSFTLNMAEIWVGKTPASDSPIGYKVRLNFGPGATDILAFNEPNNPLVYVEEAYGSFLAGKAQIDFGKFVTNVGAEVIEAKDNWNYSRSLLFALSEPYYHTGVRMTVNPNDKVSFMLGLVNGWNNLQDNNAGKTFMASATLKPSAAFSLVENYVVGPETAKDATTRNLSDTVLTYTANPKVSVMGSFDFGTDGNNSWRGVAGYLKVQAAPKVAFVPRYEYYNDPDGFTTGTAQKLQDLTLTLELKGADNFLWRIEYRGDFSNESVFKTDTVGSPSKNQNSISFGMLWSFSTKS